MLTYPVGYKEGKNIRCSCSSTVARKPQRWMSSCPAKVAFCATRWLGRATSYSSPTTEAATTWATGTSRGFSRIPELALASDVLSGIDNLVSSGLVDPDHISVAGHSYGGYMTCWLISHDHRWKSGSVLDGAVDWTDEYNFSSDGNLAWTRDSLGELLPIRQRLIFINPALRSLTLGISRRRR